MSSSILILGAGAWGTALASLAAPNVDIVELWSKNKQIVHSITTRQQNNIYLPTIKLATNIIPTENLHNINSNQALILAIPSHAVREICKILQDLNFEKNIPIIICSKGMEVNTGLMMSEVVGSVLDNPIAILSGPNFAQEVAIGLPGRTSIGCEDITIAKNLSHILSRRNFVIDINQDIIGTQVAGIIKNITAIACGASVKLGQNARAFIMTLGFKEMNILCKTLGGKKETLHESCGIGDLILTCTFETSRNMALGIKISTGKKPEKNSKMPEGFYAVQALHKLSQELGISLPLCNAIYNIIFRHKSAEKILSDLFSS